MTVEQIDQVLGQLARSHADSERLVDEYVAFVRQRDDLGAIPPNCIKQTLIEARAGTCLDARHALQLIRADLAGATAATANGGPSVTPEFHLDSGITADLSPREGALRLKEQRRNK
jgi:hypothetical protein